MKWELRLRPAGAASISHGLESPRHNSLRMRGSCQGLNARRSGRAVRSQCGDVAPGVEKLCTIWAGDCSVALTGLSLWSICQPMQYVIERRRDGGAVFESDQPRACGLASMGEFLTKRLVVLLAQGVAKVRFVVWR